MRVQVAPRAWNRTSRKSQRSIPHDHDLRKEIDSLMRLGHKRGRWVRAPLGKVVHWVITKMHYKDFTFDTGNAVCRRAYIGNPRGPTPKSRWCSHCASNYLGRVIVL